MSERNGGEIIGKLSWAIILFAGITVGLAGSIDSDAVLSGMGFSDTLIGFYTTIAWTAAGFLLLLCIYSGWLKIFFRPKIQSAGEIVTLVDFAWFVLALWAAGRAAELFSSLFRFLRRLDSFTVYHEIVLSAFLLFSIWFTVIIIKKLIRARNGSFGALAFGAAALFIFIEWFCWFNLPLSVRKFPLIEIAANLAGVTALALSLLLAGRIVDDGRSARLESFIRRIQAGIRPTAAKAVLVLLLPGVALKAWTIAGYSFRESERAGQVDSSGQAGESFRPNIVILLADALRADHLGVYGYQRGTSPFIDRIAGEGVVFEHHHSETSWTKASVASLFTGLHQSEHGVKWEDDYLAENLVTLAEEMQRAGYKCGAFISNPYLAHPNGFGRGFSEYNSELLASGHWSVSLIASLPGAGWVWKYVKLVQAKYVKARADNYNRKFTKWLETTGEPFFAYVHYMEPHAPYDPPEPYKDGEESIARLFLSGPAELARIDSKLYDGEIRYWDASVEALFASLKERDLLERTIVVLTADHGEEFYDHGGFNHHRTLYEEVVHIPLIMYGRGLLSAVGRVSRTTHAKDLGYTLLRLAGVDSSQIRLPGRDLFEDEPGNLEPIFMELYKANRTTWALIQGSDKYIIATENDGSSKSEFYDLRSDPQEKHRLPGDGPETLTLGYILNAHINSSITKNVTAAKVRLEAHLVEQLKNLGYVK